MSETTALSSRTGWLDQPYWASVLGGIAVPLIGVLLLAAIGPSSGWQPLSSAWRSPFPDEFGARALWLVSCTALISGIGSLTILCAVVVRRQGGADWGAWLRRTAIVAGAIAAFTLMFSLADAKYGLRMTWESLDTLTTRIPMRGFFHALNAAGAIPTVFVVSAVAATLKRLGPASTPTPLETLQETANDLRLLLNTICLVLAIAVFEVFAIHNWIAICVSDWNRTDARAVSLILPGALGALYTIFLAAVFAPAVLRHRYAVATTIQLATATGAPAPDDLSASWKDTLGRLLAVLIPLLTGGALPPLIEAISGLFK